MDTIENMHRKDLERLKALRYIDDDFMTVCLADNFEGVELILKIILDKDDIKIKSVKTQETMKNLQGRSAVLDIHAVDSNDMEFDVEIQRSDRGAGVKRARHNSSLLDSHILKSGDDTEKIPDSYVIFITENDVLKGNQAVYMVDRYVTIGQNKVLFGDGSHIVYVNGKYKGNDKIGKLIHDFLCTNPDDMNYEELAQKARYFKQNKEGVATMCKMLEDMRDEVAKETAERVAKETAERVAKETAEREAKETAIRMIKKGKMTLEEISEYVSILSLADLKELEAKLGN